MMHRPVEAIRPSASCRKMISVEALLHWAFARECAQLDFGESVGAMSGYGYVSGTAAIIRHEQLGCQVDGGGRSEPHPDADVVASAVAVLPITHGGHAMAVAIAEHARAVTRPDAMVGVVPQCVPKAWTRGRAGPTGKSEIAVNNSFQMRESRRERYGRVVPVWYSPTPDRIAVARRAYLSWWGALLEIRQSFQVYGGLSCWDLADDMPPMKPWIKKGC